jgi:hypothetical protein
MKILLAAIAATVAISTPVQAALNIEEAIQNKKLVLMTIGTAVYYSENCAGLTGRGNQYLVRAITLHKLDTYAFYKDKDYKTGYGIAKEYTSCSKLRSDLTDVGLGAMVR